MVPDPEAQRKQQHYSKIQKTRNRRGLEMHLLCDQPEYDADVRKGNSG